jgi:hypothetical protein
MKFKTHYYKTEGMNNHFSDMPDNQRYYKGNKVKIIDKETNDKNHLWISVDGKDIEVRLKDLSMSREDSKNDSKNSQSVPLSFPERSGEVNSV